MIELDRLSNARDEAKRVYDDAERALASARYTLNFHERALKVEWDKLASGSHGDVQGFPVGPKAG